MKKLVEDWMFFANNDLAAAEVLSGHSFPNAVAFHCQQAIEKYLKAFLVENDVPLQKIHDLIRLNETVKKVRDLGIDEDKLTEINEVYFDTRYPGEFGLTPNGMPTGEQIKEFIEFAKEVKTIISSALTEN